MITHPHTYTLWDGRGLQDKVMHNAKLNLKESFMRLSYLKSIPRRVTFSLSTSCNMACSCCPRNGKGANLDMHHIRYFEPILEYVSELQFVGYGEASCHPQFIDILEYLDTFECQKYLITNGKTLGELTGSFFNHHLDLLAVSVNGAWPETNKKWRAGSDLTQILCDLDEINCFKEHHNLTYPFTTLIMTICRSNLTELPALVDLAHAVKVDRVKAVYLTAFSSELYNESLWGHQKEVSAVFHEAEQKATAFGIELCLPYIQGMDPAGNLPHKPCSSPWRDLHITAPDGQITACMSDPVVMPEIDYRTLLDLDEWNRIWNSEYYQLLRQKVNVPGELPKCDSCFQSSMMNVNLKNAFYQEHQIPQTSSMQYSEVIL